MTDEIVVRQLTENDLAIVQRVLYLAAVWNASVPPPEEAVLQHPEGIIYHEDWGRPTDFGVVAEKDGEFVGGAYARFFSEEVHGHGYVDEETPELAVGVEAEARGGGLGTTLMKALADQARKRGLETLSLSVESDNPAMNLYRKLGYEDVDVDKPGDRMVLRL